MYDVAVTVIMHQTIIEDGMVAATKPPRALQGEMQKRNLSEKLASKVNDQMWGQNVDLSSHLSINIPLNGQFSAELDLNEIRESNKEIILHVCRKRIDVFYRKKEVESHRDILTETLNIEDLILKGHLYLPMFINTETYEFSLDDSCRLHIIAAIQGAISLSPSGLDSPVPKKKKQPLVKSLSDCSEYLRKKISKRARVQSDSDVILGKAAMGKTSGSTVEEMKNSVESVGLQKSTPLLIQGSATVNGVFKPLQLLNKGSKQRLSPLMCRWEI